MASDAGISPQQTKAIQQIVKDYLIQNPDVLVEVSKEIEKRQQAHQVVEQQKVITSNKAQIFQSAADFVYGNAKGDITVVEFFDYNCGWCKKATDDIIKLSKVDPKVRIVMKEYPIFGENSIHAAKAAMASIRQGKYWDFHVALMREKQVTPEVTFKIAERVGLNVAKLKADMEDPKIEAALKANQAIRSVARHRRYAGLHHRQQGQRRLPAGRGLAADRRRGAQDRLPSVLMGLAGSPRRAWRTGCSDRGLHWGRALSHMQ